MNVTLTEGPEGMVYDPATNAVVCRDQVYSDFVEITLYDASFTKELARQRWFLDVVSENTILNTDLQITGYEQVLTDDGSIQTSFTGMHLRCLRSSSSTDLNGAWQSINGEVYEGGIGQVYGLDMQLDQGPGNSSFVWLRLILQQVQETIPFALNSVCDFLVLTLV